MSMPSNDDLERAFDAVGGQVVQPMALRFALEKRGFDVLAATEVINKAIVNGVFGKTQAGGLFLRTRL